MREGTPTLLPTPQGAQSHPGGTSPRGLAGQGQARAHVDSRRKIASRQGGPGHSPLTSQAPSAASALPEEVNRPRTQSSPTPGCWRPRWLPRLKLGEAAPGAGVSEAWESSGGREAESRGQQELRSPEPSSSIPRDPDRLRRGPEASGGGQPAGGAGLGSWPDRVLVDD